MNIEELTKRLESEQNIVNSLERNKLGNVVVNIKDNINRPGRSAEHDKDVKELATTLTHFDTLDSVSKTFGISKGQLSNLKHGMTGAGDTASFNPEFHNKIKSSVKGVKEAVSEVALSKLERILRGITQDKIDKTNLVGLTAAASNLSKLAHVEVEESKVNNNFVFFTPRQKAEDDYEVVNVA